MDSSKQKACTPHIKSDFFLKRFHLDAEKQIVANNNIQQADIYIKYTTPGRLSPLPEPGSVEGFFFFLLKGSFSFPLLSSACS